MTQTRSRPRAITDAWHAEALKLGTLPAAHLTSWATCAVTAFLAAAVAAAGDGGADVLAAGLAPVTYAQAGFLVLGVLAATSEYHGGQVRTTLTSVPRRIELFVLKAAVLAAASASVAAVAVTAGVAVARFSLPDAPMPGGGATVRAVAGASSYLMLTALLAYAVAMTARRTVPAVTVLVCLYFVVGPLLRDRTSTVAYLPETAGSRLWLPTTDASADVGADLTRAEGAAIVVAWAVAALAVALVAFRRRDA